MPFNTLGKIAHPAQSDLKNVSKIDTNVKSMAVYPSPVSAAASDISNNFVRDISTSITSKTLKNSSFPSVDNKSERYLSSIVEFIPNLLYFDVFQPAYHQSIRSTSYDIFNTDAEFQYIRFYLDFGPPNIAQIVRFSKSLSKRLQAAQNEKKRLVAVSSPSADKCTNAAFLICAFMLLEMGAEPEKALAPLRDPKRTANLALAPYRDAGYGNATYWIDIADCIQALYAGLKQANLLDLETFNLEEYEFYERVENGDLGWIIPGYFLALATPQDTPPPHLLKYHEDVKAGRIIPVRPTSSKFKPLIQVPDLAEYLHYKMGVKGIVRLNNKLYDRHKFVEKGVEHYELYFPDGSVPPWDTIVKKFMMICDTHLLPYNPDEKSRSLSKSALAVHCKAGLGRTGTLICGWMIKTLGWSARQCISWCRIMRPGSVVGPQQNWLESMESAFLKWGQQERAERIGNRLLAEEKLNQKVAKNATSLNINNGNAKLAETAMGMIVPAQPRKENRDDAKDLMIMGMDWEPSSPIRDEHKIHPYNLRSSDESPKSNNSSRDSLKISSNKSRSERGHS